jgi:hypothetical protein
MLAMLGFEDMSSMPHNIDNSMFAESFDAQGDWCIEMNA